MKTPLLLASLTCAALPLLGACAGPSHAGDADELRDRLAGLPGVASAKLDYTAPVTLDSGKLQLRVALAEDADASAVVAVVTTTYDAFAGVHHGEEGDLDVTWRGDVVHLRSFEPDAGTSDVTAAAEQAVPVLEAEDVRVDLETQDVHKAPHVRTRFTVTTAPGPDALLAALPALDRRFGAIPHADWTVQAAPEGTWTLVSGGGLPHAEQLALFGRLRAGLPRGATVWLGDDGATSLTLPAGTTPEAAAAQVGRQLALLGGARTASYDLMVGESLEVSMIDGECSFDAGPLGQRLRRTHGEQCAKVLDQD